MINIESIVFDTVYNQLNQTHPEANITAGYDERNATYPTIIVRQTNSQAYRDSATDDCAENHARVTFEAEVVTDKENTGRSECLELLMAVDGIMQGMKFRRVHLNRPLNIDRTKWRQYARYEAIVGKPIVQNAGQQNEKTVYQMYRR